MDRFETGNLLFQALEPIVKSVRENTEPMFLKLQRMQDIYLEKNNALYSEKQTLLIKSHFESVKFKFFLTDTHLEQLWGLTYGIRLDLQNLFNNTLVKLEFTDNHLTIGSMLLESFLFEARSFIDVFQLYVYLLMGNNKPVIMSTKKFYNAMEKVQEPILRKKSILMGEYFKKNVFQTDKWGYILRSLRTMIAHQKRLCPSYDSSEKIFDMVLLNFPTIRGQTFDRLAQDIENGMFEMIRETSPILFDLEWKSGPFRQNLW